MDGRKQFPLKRKRKLASSGLWIALYGPDGAGKSAVAARLAAELAPLFSAVDLHHLRIQSGRASQANVPVTQPHRQQPRGLILSYLKLLYMFAHSWLTHLLTVTSIAAGRVVIFDRYFLDYSIDSRRYRLAAESVRFASLLGKLAPRPDLQFVLDVPARELQRRKSEVTLFESRRQRQEYVASIGHLPNAVVVNADRPIQQVASHIISEVLRYTHASSRLTAEAELAGL
jgi:thymidylate kinase